MTSLLAESPRCVAPVAARLGEGPLWDPRIARLLFVDIKGGKIFRYDPERERVEAIPAEGMASALGLAREGYVCARRDGFHRLFIEDGAARFEPFADPEANLPANRFNDGKVDPRGGFWAGTMDDSESGAASGAWWRLAPDGKAAKLDDGYIVTNGPAFDPARGRVFLTDSAKQTIFVAETDGAALGEKRVFLQFGSGDGYPDGMEIDAEGALWIAFWDGACLRRFSPEGERLETVTLPVPRPTSLAFAGDRLFVTSASIGLDTEQLKAAPLSGGLFAARLKRPLETGSPRVFTG